jgi:hypothetical protein
VIDAATLLLAPDRDAATLLLYIDGVADVPLLEASPASHVK